MFQGLICNTFFFLEKYSCTVVGTKASVSTDHDQLYFLFLMHISTTIFTIFNVIVIYALSAKDNPFNPTEADYEI